MRLISNPPSSLIRVKLRNSGSPRHHHAKSLIISANFHMFNAYPPPPPPLTNFSPQKRFEHLLKKTRAPAQPPQTPPRRPPPSTPSATNPKLNIAARIALRVPALTSQQGNRISPVSRPTSSIAV